MKHITLFSLSIFLYCMAAAQQPGIVWQRLLGSAQNDNFHRLEKLADGNLMLAGMGGTISGNKTVAGMLWCVKMDTAGNTLQQWGFSTIGNRTIKLIPANLAPTKDSGCIILAGVNTIPSGEEYDYGVIRLDKHGNVLFEKVFTTLTYSKNNLTNAVETLDGGFLLVGASNGAAGGDKTEERWSLLNDIWAIKIDKDGNKEWDRTIGGDGSDYPAFVHQYSDGTYVIGATSGSGISGNKTTASKGGNDIWIITLSSTGSIQQQFTIGGTADDILVDAKTNSNKQLYLAAHSTSGISGDKTEINYGSNDYWVLKTNAAGNILWQNTIGGSNVDLCQAIDVNMQGECFVTGRTNSPISGEKTEASLGIDMWAMKLNAYGDLVWENTIGGSLIDESRSVIAFQDGSCIISGATNSPQSGDKTLPSLGGQDHWIIKLEGPGASLLPLDIVRFNGYATATGVVLNWHTANMQQVKGFSIEKSNDAIHFTSCGFVDATLAKQYSFTDSKTTAGKTYYRLKSIDFDGTFSYSKIVTINYASTGTANVFPNPIHKAFTVSTSFSNFEYRIADAQGKIVQQGKSAQPVLQLNSQHWPKGFYLLHIWHQQSSHSIKLLKE